jgi:hypothetical protein
MSNVKEKMTEVIILVSNAKVFILGTYHGVMANHLQKYLDEFCCRFNRRFWSGQGFDRLVGPVPSQPLSPMRS